MKIDLNCDLGESFGPYKIGNDEEIMKYITSANIACGFHGGDPRVMNDAVKFAKANNVAIGAHVGFDDLYGFGRRNIDISSPDLRCDIIYQIGALREFCKIQGVDIEYIKPHGAMGNMAFVDRRIATVIIDTLIEVMPSKKILVLPGTMAHKVAIEKGVNFVLEVFADRNYNDDLTLVSRKENNAVIHEPEEAVDHILRMLIDRKVKTINNKLIDINAQSVCVHGDTPEAMNIVKLLHSTLSKENIKIQPFSI